MSREVMQQALEALEVSTDWDVNATGKQAQSMRAITALRRALEQQPADEPVARVVGYYGGRCVIEPLNPAMVMPDNMALYTRPQPAGPRPTCEALARTVMMDQGGTA